MPDRTLYPVIIMLMISAGCAKDIAKEWIPKPCSQVSATYTVDIEPIMTTHCSVAGCHDNTTAAHGIRLSSYSNVVSAVNSAGADFLCALKHEGGCFPMPKLANKLPDSLILKIECWIEKGMIQ